MDLIDCQYQTEAAAILEIFNEAIANSTALYAYQPRTMDFMENWFRDKQAGNFPVIGAVDENGELLGFASYGPFRPWPAYKYTVEHSVYVHKDHRGRKIGKMLMDELISRAVLQQYHVMIAAVDVTNQGSIALHEKLGFSHAGTIRHAGFKFERWCDLAFYQLLLTTPEHPVAG